MDWSADVTCGTVIGRGGVLVIISTPVIQPTAGTGHTLRLDEREPVFNFGGIGQSMVSTTTPRCPEFTPLVRHHKGRDIEPQLRDHPVRSIMEQRKRPGQVAAPGVYCRVSPSMASTAAFSARYVGTCMANMCTTARQAAHARPW